MNWASEIWGQWYEAVGDSNEHPPTALADREARKFDQYARRLERELEAVWEERRKRASAAGPSR